jgi:hypothetical protein
VFGADADTYVDSSVGQSGANFGKDNPLVLQGTSSERLGLVRFILAGQPPGARVARAILYIHVQNAPNGLKLNFYQVHGSWEEMVVTWDSRPDLAATHFGQVSITDADNESCLRAVDLPPGLVQGWIDGTLPNQGLAVEVVETSAVVHVTSREETSHPGRIPQLSVVYEAP